MNLRATLRLADAAALLLAGLFTVVLAYPFCSSARRLALKQGWSRRLLRALGIELRVSGTMPPQGLIVANHISFIDIFAINAAAPSAFVSKDEVRRWPLIGFLAARTDTIFLERGSRNAAQRAREHLIDELRNGTRVALFPEGTTSRGASVLPFHAALLQSAIDAEATVTPVTLRYLDGNGCRTEAAAYVDDMSLLDCLRAIATADRILAEVRVLPGIATSGVDRRHLAAHAHRAIAHALAAAPE